MATTGWQQWNGDRHFPGSAENVQVFLGLAGPVSQYRLSLYRQDVLALTQASCYTWPVLGIVHWQAQVRSKEM